MLEHAPLEAVYIYFDTASYDQIERDEKVIVGRHLILIVCFSRNDLKVTLEGMIGLIGGTMGLLTGFSVLSGVEIIYFLLRLPNIL